MSKDVRDKETEVGPGATHAAAMGCSKDVGAPTFQVLLEGCAKRFSCINFISELSQHRYPHSPLFPFPIPTSYFLPQVLHAHIALLPASVLFNLVLHVRPACQRLAVIPLPKRTRRHSMPARETEAIILKTFPLGEADRLVSFLGRSSGRMRGVAAGARRIKNRYGSTLELLAHVHLWYFERETRELVRIQQAELLESFHKAQSDYALSTGLALVSETAEIVLPEHEQNEPMFRLILLTVRELERRGNGNLPLSYFAFWTVRLAGWLPRFDACAECDKPFGKQPAYQAAWHPGLLCEEHRRPGMKPISADSRHLAVVFTRERLDKLDATLEAQPCTRELREVALNWIEHHTERKLGTRELLETP